VCVIMCMCVSVCEWVCCSGVHGVYYWSPAVLHLSLFSVVKHEAKSLLNLRAHSRTRTHTHTPWSVFTVSVSRNTSWRKSASSKNVNMNFSRNHSSFF